jgi:hypothetical protein
MERSPQIEGCPGLTRIIDPARTFPTLEVARRRPASRLRMATVHPALP